MVMTEHGGLRSFGQSGAFGLGWLGDSSGFVSSSEPPVFGDPAAAEQYRRGWPRLMSATWTGRVQKNRWQRLMMQSGCSGQGPGAGAGV